MQGASLLPLLRGMAEGLREIDNPGNALQADRVEIVLEIGHDIAGKTSPEHQVVATKPALKRVIADAADQPVGPCSAR